MEIFEGMAIGVPESIAGKNLKKSLEEFLKPFLDESEKKFLKTCRIIVQKSLKVYLIHYKDEEEKLTLVTIFVDTFH